MSEVNKLTIREANSDDIIFLFNRLRQADKEELKLLNYTPLRALMESYTESEECYTALVNNIVSGMFGIAGFKNNIDTASIWFLGSDEINKIPFKWIKIGKSYIDYFLTKYKYLINTVSKQNKEHIKWLKLMGANFTEIENNKHFIQFLITKER